MGALRDMEKALAADEALAAKFTEALKGAGAAGARSDVEAIVLAAGAAGFELAPEDAEKELAEAQQLSQGDLEAVAGGVLDKDGEDSEGHENSCIATWHCFTALMHTKDSSNSSCCWSDYWCMLLEN